MGESERRGNAPTPEGRPPRWSPFSPRDIASLVVFRIAFGGILFAEAVRYLASGQVRSAYVQPELHFKYFGFEWVQPWPGYGMYLHYQALAALALCVVLGLGYRLCAFLLFIGVTHVFLLDQARYLNHYYLVSLVSLLMVIVPAHRAFSLDALRRPEIRSGSAPAWAYWLLRAQLAIVYIYAGLAKINPDWLRGEPLRSWLAKRSDMPVIGPLLSQEWTVYLFSYGGLLLDLMIVPLLLWRPTRIPGFCLALAFHLMNAAVFEIGIFPWFMIAATLLFFPPGWPRRFLPGRHHGRPSDRARDVPVAAAPARWSFGQRALLCFLGAYLLVQVLVPLRHWLYPGDVSWTEEGHRFSWHMKLRTKRGTARFFAKDPATGKTWELNARKRLTSRQFRKMSTHPDMILQFSHRLARELRDEGRPGIEIRVLALASLNGRKMQLLVDPKVNLAAEPRSLAPARWIMPLRKPLPGG